MLVSVAFTSSGLPAIGLTPTVKIWDIGNSVAVLPPTAMTEVGDGIYKYDFTSYDSSKKYIFVFDGGITLLPGERFHYASNDIFLASTSFGPIAEFS